MLPIVHPIADWAISRPLIREKSADEYVCSVDCSFLELQKALHAYGYRHNLLATLKYILVNPTRAFEAGSWAFRETLRAKWMQHCYFFGAAEERYTFHLNHHKEINYLHSPKGHENGERSEGDPDHTFRDALDAAGIEYDVLEEPKYG